MGGQEHRDITDQQSDICPNCGAHDDALKGLGPLCEIRDTAYEQLRTLFLKQIDKYHCPICHKPVGLRPTVIVVIDEKREYLCCFGDRALAAPGEPRKRFLDVLKSEGAQVEVFATLDELRRTYAKRLASMMNRILQTAEAKSQDPLEALFAGGWRDFPSNHFAAAGLILSTSLPGVGVKFPSGLEAVFGEIVDFQVGVWLAFCSSWSGELAKDRTLEEDLSRYLSPEAILEQAADEFLRITENPEQESPIERFCLEVVRASLCVWCKKPNPRLQEWADLFVEQEVARGSLGEQSIAMVVGEERVRETLPLLVALEIGPKRARDTIPYKDLYDACARRLLEDGFESLAQVEKIGRKVGYPYLAKEVMANLRFSSPEDQAMSVDEFLKHLRPAYESGFGGDDPEGLLEEANLGLDLLGKARSPETLEQVAEGLKEILGGDIETHAQVEAWLCSHLLQDYEGESLPVVVLERIGDQAQLWEQKLTPRTRARLQTERSNALRRCGRGAEAIAVAEAVIADLEAAGEPIDRELRRNLGILYREAGQHEQALDIFLGLLPDADPGFQLRLVDSIFSTYNMLGRTAEALPYLEEAARLATGPYAKSRPRILAGLATAKQAAGKLSEALNLLRQIPVDEIDDPKVLLPYAWTWFYFQKHPELLEEEDHQRLSDLLTKIIQVNDATQQSNDMLFHVQTTYLLAFFAEDMEFDDRKFYWEQVDVESREYQGAPHPMALVALARENWAEGEQEKARSYLLELPSAVAQRYAPEQDLSLKIDALSDLPWMFYSLVGAVSQSGSFEDLRLVAELQRDMLGRIAAASAGDRKASSTGFVAPDTQMIIQLGGPIAVFEWVDGPDGLIGLATFIAADSMVAESILGPLEVDLDLLAERITQRLSEWFPSRAGGPLDLKDWRSFEQWLAQELEGRLPEGGRLVVIEHERVAGLQWHLAAAPRWRVSYAPSWSWLLTSRQATVPVRDGAIGLAMVPKYREAEDNLRALESSVSRTVQLASELGYRLNSALREACDRDALVGVLEGTRATKILCHGFVDPVEEVVALMVAHNGELPLGNSLAANTPSGRRHRFNWRDCQQLKIAPAVLFSAACGSGQSHHAGLGEELGIFSTLRRFGTRSVIAPRWDIEPKIVLPILDNVIERYLRTGVELGEAFYAACAEASEGLPHWQAWALALEGDWK
jgi:tetratricopeptide (TPR) repeat protein